MIKIRLSLALLATIIFLSVAFVQNAYTQTEVEAWGNITGIRIDGQLMEFESSLRVVGKDWSSIAYTALEKQRPRYSRDGNRQIISTRIDSLNFTEAVEDIGAGMARIRISVSPR